MKAIKNFKLLLIIILLTLQISCIKETNTTLPDITINELNIIANSNITAVKSALKQEFINNNNLIYTFNIGDNLYIEGYVISSDAAGNFYKKLYIQDSPDNPSSGIEILLNKTSISETFEVGRKIILLLDGLSVGYDDGSSSIDPTNNLLGKYTLGSRKGYKIDEINNTDIDKHLFRTSKTVQIIPTKTIITNIKESHINTMVQLSNIQFKKLEMGKTYSGDPYDEFDGFRELIECETSQIIPLQTSTYASFKSNVIPSLKGNINFVLTKDYRSEFIVGIINSPSEILFSETQRCDPPVLDCDNEVVNGDKIVFKEDFETIFNNTDIDIACWRNINVNNGETIYTSEGFNGNRYLEIGAYRTGENPLEVWLISPHINLDQSTDEILTFDTNTGFDNGQALTTYISNDFIDDVESATWIELDAVLSKGPASGYNSFISSGAINISCLSGKVSIAFKYRGADRGVTTTFQIDNVKVVGK